MKVYLTVTVQVSFTTFTYSSLTVTVIVALPFFSTFMLPFSSTEATFGLEDSYLTVYFTPSSASIFGLSVVDFL